VHGVDATGTVVVYDPDLDTFEAGKGYWIKLNQDEAINFLP